MTRRLAALALLCAPSALAYNEAIHALVTGRAFASRAAWLDETLAAPTPEDLEAFRALFFHAASNDGRFAARWPTVESFTAWEFKQLLMLNPAARVHGFDPVDLRATKRGELLQLASRWPDDDERNRYRYAYDASHRIVRAPDGSPLPYDPATLDFGGLTGTTSQGHAHYGLVEGPLSDDPEVLKKDPRRFAVPRTAHAWGAELSGIYTDLALLAASSDLHGREWLAASFAGAAFHHIEDVANQIHTVQVGIYDFFRDAWLQSKLRDVTTLGGVLGPRRTLEQIGVRLVANHHLFSEDLFAKRVAEAESSGHRAPQVADAVAGLDRDDAQFAAQARSAVERSGGAFGRALAQAMIDVSSTEGADVYALAYRLSAKTLRDGLGHEYDGAKGDDPDAFLAPPSPDREATLTKFYQLEARGLRRAATALRLWEAGFEAVLPTRPSAPTTRILAIVLPYQDAAAARRASYVPAARQSPGIAWGYPLAALVAVAAASFLIARKRRAATAQLQL
jgi:hypothetical protein